MGVNLNPTFATEGTFTPDNLIADDYPLMTETVTIASGQDLTRGAVLGKVSSSGEYKLSASGAGDGSETPTAILLQDTDASAGALSAPVAISGAFNARALTVGAGHTVASITDGLRD